MVDQEKISFAELKEQTAGDCEQIAQKLVQLAGKVREGNTTAFEEFWIEGGTEEGNAEIFSIRERVILRYSHRFENLKK